MSLTPVAVAPDPSSGTAAAPERALFAAEQIASKGLRVTRQRVAVYAAIGTGEHLDVEVITARVRGTLGAISQQAVYDVLAALTGVGLLRRIEPAGRPTLFEVRIADNHHHLVCRSCGAVGDVDCAVGERPCLEPSDTGGFLLDEAEVTWWGLCPACQSTDPMTGRPASTGVKTRANMNTSADVTTSANVQAMSSTAIPEEESA